MPKGYAKNGINKGWFKKGVAIKKLPRETIERIRQKNLGQSRSELTKKRISEAVSGEKSVHWKGGLTTENAKIRGSREYSLWRLSVYKRDNYSCIWCGKKAFWDKKKKKMVGIHADHIKPFSLYPELRFAIDNGRTLCVDCHKKTETYGWKMINIKNRIKKNNI